ncbi:MAG: O-antigen ligase family protein [Patescibacteria group bacterium]|jgi:O-antigen ligase
MSTTFFSGARDKLIVGLIGILCVVSAVFVGEWNKWLMATLSVLIFCIVFLVARSADDSALLSLVRHPVVRLLIVFLVLLIGISFFVPGKYDAIAQTMILAMYILLFITGWFIGIGTRYSEVIIRVIAGTAIVSSLATIVLAIVHQAYRAEGLLGNANALGGYIAISFPLVLWFAWGIKSILLRIVVIAPVAIALFMSFSYTAWVSMGVGFIFFIFFARKNIPWKRAGLTFASILVVVIGYIGVRFIETHSIRDSVALIPIESVQISFSQRYAFNEVSLSMFIDHPVYGVGLGSYQQEYPRYAVSVLEQPKYAHNYYLELLAETGLVALVFFAVLYVLIRQFWLYLRKNKEWSSIRLEVALVFAVTIGLIHAVFDFSLHFPSVGVLLWLTMGIAVRRTASVLTTDEHPLPRRSSTLMRGVIMAVAAIIFARGCLLGLSAMRIDTGDVQRDRGSTEQAIVSYDAAATFDPDPDVILQSAQLEFRQDTPESLVRAREKSERLLLWDAHSYFAYHLLGGIAYSENRIDDAVVNLEKAIALDPVLHPNFHYDLAGAYRKQQKDDAALILLEEILQQYDTDTPYSANPHVADQLAHIAYLAGQIYDDRGNTERAYEYYVQAIEFEPSFQTAVKARDALQNK